MVTNNEIRRYLHLPTVKHEFNIYQVDQLGVNYYTLMFINKPDVDPFQFLPSVNSVYLISEDYPPVHDDVNDFIRVKNPKYVFCRVVEAFALESKLQREFRKYHRFDATQYCRECLIGTDCQIDPGAIIGGTDFSPVMGEDRSELVQFPQLGGVRLGDHVVVKYNTMIGKGTFGFTEIGDNTMIDFGCQIGHNCTVGKSCIIAAGTIIGGSTKIGDNTTIGMGAKIRNGLTIGKNVSIGMGSVVIKDIPDGCVVVGNPARIIDHDNIFNERGLV